MITSSKQAAAIQERRVKSGKRGYAKAVRRAVRGWTSVSGQEYRAVMNSLPVNWNKPAKQQAAA